MLKNKLVPKTTEILFCFLHKMVVVVGVDTTNDGVLPAENNQDWDWKVDMHENLGWDLSILLQQNLPLSLFRT